MESRIKFAGVSFKLQMTVGLCLTVVILALSLLYHTEVSIILLAAGGTLAGLGLVSTLGRALALWRGWHLARLDLEGRRQEVRLITYRADKAALEAEILAFPGSQRLITLPGRAVSVIDAQPLKMLPAGLPAATVDLLPALDSVQRCLIVGASDAGKTTLLQWLIARRLNTSRVVVIDPHGWPGKWPAGCNVVGTGRAYTEIDNTLTALVQMMTRRYTEIGRGEVAELAHDRITVVIDEWRAIVQNVGQAADAIKTLLTESRKAAFSVFVASHSERVKALGIEGEGDLKDGFAVVRLAIVDGQRAATLDTGNGETPASLPGAYAHVTTGPAQPLDLEPEPTPTERQIIELAQAGESVSAIAAAVFGSKGGPQNDKVKAILSKFDGV